ncbi:hypothetical protein B0A54_12432 [Friedmanniomyces endolithicus]|uniref:beta-glucosidase n=1 Tax=Friedmanniomyces endolithicus TaxID=329885 RepID=A0A4U0UL01_9PEZI|nr:hypothetical protein LTS09_003733 [Friedmanniomyces endolithicus]TKA36418.1 hypothetical protein B0A54_12432 [Friedmanniomyces endolithicus]
MDGPAHSGNEKAPLLKGVQQSKFIAFCRRHKRIVIPVAIMILLLPLLGLIALKTRHAHARNWTSPVVYPSPQGYGAGNWSAAYVRARAMVGNMSLEEMNNVTLGVVDTTSGCVGVSGSAPQHGFPGLCFHDAGNGVRNTDGVNAYASGIHIGASWNATLAYERAQFMGAEFKRKGVNVALGPVVGPIGRIAEGGRNFEAFAADPYLDGILGAQSVIGLQESVIASIKHFVAYEQETNRNPIANNGKPISSTSANLDDQTMHELYLWPFQDLVHAGAGCAMCSYNRINNTYACENSKAMNGLLKGELNFQGFVVSDWVGQHSGLPSADAGLDMAMPTSGYWNERQLEKAVDSGALNQTRLIDMATRIVATYYQFGQDRALPLGVGMPPNLLLPHNYTDAKDSASKSSLLQQAIEGHVLVKNIKGALPLKQPKVLSIFGYDAVQQSSFVPSVLFPQSWEAIGLGTQQSIGIASNAPVQNPPEVQNGTLIDASTQKQCDEFDDHLGDAQTLAEITGSKAHHRFSGPQIMRYRTKYPTHYEQTDRISLVSSFLASVFLGKIAPIDISDVTGMNLWSVSEGAWDDDLLELAAGSTAAVPELKRKLGHVPNPAATPSAPSAPTS